MSGHRHLRSLRGLTMPLTPLLLAWMLLLLLSAPAAAHGVAAEDARLLQSIDGVAVGPLLYLGAKHMVTGYDHLLFLAGVVFFLYRLRHILLYVSLFTLGHSLTLLAGAIGGLRVDAYLVDAVIGLSIVYKAFENMGGFGRVGWRPDTRVAVLVFGLFHGLGLATKLQALDLSPNGLVGNIVSFNVGVEVGQLVALTLVILALTYWRTRGRYAQHAFVTNAALMSAGFLLTGYQLAGYVLAPR
jgi:HupE / UreJ protein